MIYFVYETDKHQTYCSTCIKMVETNHRRALAFYKKIAPEWEKEEWNLYFSYFNIDEHREDLGSRSNILRLLTVIKSTEENE
ncbi:hypothetical protein HN682_00800 [Candidatus Peregrinibacteria bacterium]|jgi:hypothetical protein|nr:hypothetical protein [Candidatus Peregrinibacteria bacterium]